MAVNELLEQIMKNYAKNNPGRISPLFNIRYISKKICEIDGEYLRYVPNKNLTDEIVEIAMNREDGKVFNTSCVNYFNQLCKRKELMKKLYKYDIQVLSHLTEEEITKEIIDYIIESNQVDAVLNFDCIKNSKIAMTKICKISGEHLNLANESIIDKELVDIAFEHEEESKKYIPRKGRETNPFIIEKLVEKDGNNIIYVSNECITKELLDKATSHEEKSKRINLEHVGIYEDIIKLPLTIKYICEKNGKYFSLANFGNCTEEDIFEIAKIATSHQDIEKKYEISNDPYKDSIISKAKIMKSLCKIDGKSLKYAKIDKFGSSWNKEELQEIIKIAINNGFNIKEDLCDSLGLNDSLIALTELRKYNKDVFKYAKLTLDFIQQNKEIQKDLYDIDLSNIISTKIELISKEETKNFIKEYSKRYGNRALLKIINKYANLLNNIKIDNFNNEIENKELIDKKIMEAVYKSIIEKHFDYRILLDVPEFIKAYPELFLPDDFDEEIKQKFYSNILDEYDLREEVFHKFNECNTYISFGLRNEFDSIKETIKAYTTPQESNEAIKRYFELYVSIPTTLKKQYMNFVINNYKSFDINKIEDMEELSEFIKQILESNSSDIRNLNFSLFEQILKSGNYLETLKKAERIFLNNNIPTVGKIYLCFDILYPNFTRFNLDKNIFSPVLYSKSLRGKEITVFADLIKASLGSNNKSLIEYIDNIEKGTNIYEKIVSENKTLSKEETSILYRFANNLQGMYNVTRIGKKNNDNTVITKENMVEEITKIKKLLSPTGELNYNLADRLIKMFCHFAGIDTLEQAKEYMNNKIKESEERNIELSKSKMVLEKGDLIKGIGSVHYLNHILQNGSVSKEYLGGVAESDCTPLDTDVSMILADEGTNEEKIEKTRAKDYGLTWLVLKEDNRFTITRNHIDRKVIINKKEKDKLELFNTLAEDHYGIRTGFSSSDINYIIASDSRVYSEIAMNGFYIPVVDIEGNILFTYEDYKELRSKMAGLKEYNEYKYNISDNLITDEIEEIAQSLEFSEEQAKNKREKIVKMIKKAMNKLENKLEVRESISNDLEEGYIEFIDTGSTGRGTNIPNAGDFDFIMKLDQRIILNPNKLNKIIEAIKEEIQEVKEEDSVNGDLRYRGVKIEGLDEEIDLDITFVSKTDKVKYSTDMCIKERLNSIKEQYPDKYKLVIANIIKAKEVLKKGECYKSANSKENQGGLGGVGVENWILQNGGSLEDAAREFMKKVEQAKLLLEEETKVDINEYDLFKKIFKVYDFGQNHMAEKKELYPYDEYVYSNMNEEGYIKMKKVLKEYLDSLDKSKNKVKKIK